MLKSESLGCHEDQKDSHLHQIDPGEGVDRNGQLSQEAVDLSSDAAAISTQDDDFIRLGKGSGHLTSNL